MPFSQRLKQLGPGILFAGAAIGVSHLVQSTRAGAGYGFSLLWVLLFANLVNLSLIRLPHSFSRTYKSFKM